MKVALAHHWLTQYRGGEKVLERIAATSPEADLHTLVHRRSLDISGLKRNRVIPSRLHRLPGIQKSYRHLLPFHPAAIRAMKVAENVDLLISSDASMIKGISFGEQTKHVCYCHSPPRYLWELGNEYKRTSMAARIMLDRVGPTLRRFDYQAAQRVTHFIANSHFVADRISRYYGRDSEVIYPPVAVDHFRFDQPRKRYSLVISELVPYKRIDLAVEAFNKMGRELVVIGDGPERKRLQAMARPNIRFLGRQPFEALKAYLESAETFVFPGIEDFGITPVEAQAAGCPVVAFRGGGALETVIEERTGVFFDQQDSDCLADALRDFEVDAIDPATCAANAANYSADAFDAKFRERIEQVMSPHVPSEKTPRQAV